MYKFKARDIRTGDYVIGDLAYAETTYDKTKKIKPMIVEHRIHGGMLYITSRRFIDEKTIELFYESLER